MPDTETEWAAEASASVRGDLTGAYTDCSPAVDREPSLIVNLAIGHRARARIRPSPQPGVRVTVDGGRSEAPPVLADVVTEIAGRLKVDAVQIDVSLPVPPGTGLGTSAAQGVAVTAVCARYSGYEVSRDALAELAAAAERSAGIAGGRQDQYAAAHGGCHLWQIGPGQQPAVGARITLAPALTSAFVLAHPGGTRDSGNLVDVIAQRQQDDGAIRTALRRLNELAAPIAATLTCGDLPALAEHLHAVRQLQRALHPAVVDTRVEEKLHALPGVLAAKPCGGGGTGAAWLVLCQPGAADTVTAMLPAAGLHAITVEPDPQGVATTGPADPGAHPR